ncbi:MAG: peptidase S41 [Spirochaetae bacterium HGW-Spirochaetae-1]|jgi:carboxyl-terminal processing protease|nr:MAG: peptidase S41 [Spirochaetae bacterium HGW-Spirochaetae-1]
MLKKIKERNIHFLTLAFLVGLFIGINVSFLASAEEPAHRYLDYFHRVYQILRTEYVEDVDNKELFFGAIRGMIGALGDPFSRFLDEKGYEELKEMTTGKFVGVGIEITVRDNEIVVISPIDDSPAMRSGIKAGDVIKKVDSTPIKGKKLSEIVKMIKGLPRTKVQLSIEREGFDELLDIDIERAPIKIQSVEYAMIENTSIGYIKIKNFGSETSQDVTDALKNLEAKKAEKLIIDLRYNPGGLLTAAVSISDLFLEKGKVVVSTRGRKGSENERIFKSENNPVSVEDIVVLVNKGSASASEIFAGAMRDNKRGKLVGEKTFGKGSVQKSYNLDDNIGVAITIAKYYTPSGELIHNKGINPDFEVKSEELDKDDKKGINQVTKLKLMEKFIPVKMEYNAETKKQFELFLKKHDVVLSEKTAHLMLKNKIYELKKRPLYDLEFDNQLVRAMEVITGKVQ